LLGDGTSIQRHLAIPALEDDVLHSRRGAWPACLTVERSFTTRSHDTRRWGAGVRDDHIALAGGKELAGTRAPAKVAARDLSGSGADARAQPFVYATDAADRGRRLLARPPATRRSARARARGRERRAVELDLAPERQSARWPASELPVTAGTLPGGRLLARSWLLLCLRAAGLQLRLAPRPVEARTQPERRMAHRLCGGLALVERAERLRSAAQAAAVAALRHHRNASVEDRRGRPPHAAVPGLARAQARCLAIAARVLGMSQPAGHQPRGSCGQMRRRGDLSRAQPDRHTRKRLRHELPLAGRAHAF
jgi:hypothetical protein